MWPGLPFPPPGGRGRRLLTLGNFCAGLGLAPHGAVKRLPAHLVCLAAIALPAQALAQTAEVLPQGIFKADVNYVYADTGVRRIHGELDPKSAMDPSSGADLITSLAGLGPTATGEVFGRSYIEFSASASVLAPSLFYGLTERISVGLALPVFLDANVTLRQLEVGTASLGYNPDFAGDMTRQSPVLSVADPRAEPGATGVKRMLTDVFGYEPLDDWKSSGLGDLIAAGRVSLLQSRYLRAAVQPSLVVPTGEPDNVDNLLDFGLGSGQFDVGTLALTDVVFSGWLALNLRGGYVWQLPNEQRARIFEFEALPIAPLKELPGEYAALGESGVVERDLGDIWQVGSSLRLKTGVVTVAAGYDFQSKGRDRYSSHGKRHPAMEARTASDVHIVSGEICASWVEAFLRDDALAPVELGLKLSQAVSDQETSILSQAMVTATLFFGKKPGAK